MSNVACEEAVATFASVLEGPTGPVTPVVPVIPV